MLNRPMSVLASIGKRKKSAHKEVCKSSDAGYTVLNEKRVDFQLAEVALKDPNTGLWHQLENKPAWFTRLNPLGKARFARVPPEPMTWLGAIDQAAVCRCRSWLTRTPAGACAACMRCVLGALQVAQHSTLSSPFE